MKKDWREKYMLWLGYTLDTRQDTYYHPTLWFPRITKDFVFLSKWWGLLIAPFIAPNEHRETYTYKK